MTLPELVRRWEQEGTGGAALLREVRHGVERATRRLPDAFFELGRRDDEALRSLANRVFTRCGRTALGRHPFATRTPFRTYVEEAFEAPAIRYHTFYARLSVTRELVHGDYALACARDPVLRARDTLYRQLGPVLSRVATRVADPPHETWTVPGTAGLVRTRDEVGARLRPGPLDTLVPEALRLYGAPVSRSELTHALAPVLCPPAGSAPPSTGPREDTLAIRRAVAAAWAELDALDRALLLGLARGEDSTELLARDPRLGSPAALSRAARRVGDRFVTRVVAEVGGTAAPDLTPTALLERVAAVLLESLPELPHA